MARLPRDVTGARLIARLEALGDRVVWRKGSHVWLERPGPDTHAITVPDHAALRIGTLAAILQAVGAGTRTSREELFEMLGR
jgi:predicted RNA binding protein YcfA (HicA-like mRNA interferase family)